MANGLRSRPAPRRSERIVISVDAMGGDRGPAAVVAGLVDSAADEPRHRLHPAWRRGRTDTRWSRASRACRAAATLRHAPRVVTMQDKPSQVMRHGEGTSMWSAIDARASKGEATVAVSCGNTGALMARVDAPPAQAAGREPPRHRLPVALAQSRRVQRDAGRRAPTSRPMPTTCCNIAMMGASYARNGLGLDAPARRPAECRHRRTQGPGRTEAGA